MEKQEKRVGRAVLRGYGRRSWSRQPTVIRFLFLFFPFFSPNFPNSAQQYHSESTPPPAMSSLVPFIATLSFTGSVHLPTAEPFNQNTHRPALPAHGCSHSSRHTHISTSQPSPQHTCTFGTACEPCPRLSRSSSPIPPTMLS